ARAPLSLHAALPILAGALGLLDRAACLMLLTPALGVLPGAQLARFLHFAFCGDLDGSRRATRAVTMTFAMPAADLAATGRPAAPKIKAAVGALGRLCRLQILVLRGLVQHRPGLRLLLCFQPGALLGFFFCLLLGGLRLSRLLVVALAFDRVVNGGVLQRQWRCVDPDLDILEHLLLLFISITRRQETGKAADVDTASTAKRAVRGNGGSAEELHLGDGFAAVQHPRRELHMGGGRHRRQRTGEIAA